MLEIACGLGRVSRFVAPHCGHLWCTDILDEALARARETLRQERNVSFAKIDGYGLAQFGDATFDVVYSFTTFFHFDFELVVRYFAEIARVLRPRGRGIIEFKRWQDSRDVDQLLDKIASVGGVAAYGAQLDKWRYVSKESLRVLCDYYGLEVVDGELTCYVFAKPAS